MTCIRTMLIVCTFFLLLALFETTGCSPMVSSGIPQALNSDTQMEAAGKSQGITLGRESTSEVYDSNSLETEHRFYASLSSGTTGQLLAAYQQEVERTITNMGGEIHGTGVSRETDGVRDFSYDYRWSMNEGMVRVYSFVGTMGRCKS